MNKKKRHSSANMLLAVIGGVAYISLLLLFGWQTWQFVSWLFPDDQMLMRVLAVISFDGCALLFGCVHLFYRFASRPAKMWILVGWLVTNILSALASIFYLVIESMFRFHLDVSQQTVNVGYSISIIALIFDGLILTFWVYLEWQVRHPHHDDFDEYEQSDLVIVDEYHHLPTAVPPQSTPPEIDYAKLAQAMKAVQPSSPLAQPQLPTDQADQVGSNHNQ